MEKASQLKNTQQIDAKKNVTKNIANKTFGFVLKQNTENSCKKLTGDFPSGFGGVGSASPLLFQIIKIILKKENSEIHKIIKQIK